MIFLPSSVVLVAGLAASAATQEDPPKAATLLESVAAAMKDASAVAFGAEVRTRVEQLEITQKAKLLLARPDRARLVLTGFGQDAVIVLDGTSTWHYLKSKRRYLKVKQLGTSKLEQYGAGPAAPLFFQQDARSLAPCLANATVTLERLGDVDCQVVAWKVGSEESSLWIEGTRLRRFRATRSVNGQKFEQTIDYGVFDLAPTVAEDAFQFTPPERALPLEPEGEEELLAVGAPAPDFTVTALDGKQKTRADFGDGPLLITFWFYGCATCREELPRLDALHREYAERGVRMLAVNFGDSAETVATYFQNAGFTMTAAMQEKDAVSRAFGVRVYPTSYLVDQSGNVTWRRVGFDEETLRAALDAVAPPTRPPH